MCQWLPGGVRLLARLQFCRAKDQLSLPGPLQAPLSPLHLSPNPCRHLNPWRVCKSALLPRIPSGSKQLSLLGRPASPPGHRICSCKPSVHCSAIFFCEHSSTFQLGTLSLRPLLDETFSFLARSHFSLS